MAMAMLMVLILVVSKTMTMVMVVVVVTMVTLAVVAPVIQMTRVTAVFMPLGREARTVIMKMLGLVMQMTVPILVAKLMVYALHMVMLMILSLAAWSR